MNNFKQDQYLGFEGKGFGNSMKKEILISEEDFKELERKANLYEEGRVLISVQFSAYSMIKSHIYSDEYFGNRRVDFYGHRVDCKSAEIKETVEKEFTRVLPELQYILGAVNLSLEERNEFNTMEENYNKIPKWLKKIFN